MRANCHKVTVEETGQDHIILGLVDRHIFTLPMKALNLGQWHNMIYVSKWHSGLSMSRPDVVDTLFPLLPAKFSLQP